METTDTQTRDIILRLKRVKAARGLSCGRICAMVAEAGGSVSLSTVKRVFADGSEDWSFRVCDTVQPIADVLLAEGGVPITPSEVAPSYNNSGCPRWSTKKEASFVR